MKSLTRKSFNQRPQISTPLPHPSVSKPVHFIMPPQKVIRAQSSYRPTAPQELPFQKGDFFYVIKDVDINGAWYEAHNPVSGARGLVPRSMFEEFNKTPTSIRTSHSDVEPSAWPEQTIPKSPMTHVYYAIVLHDFVAERPDELDAKAGDPISVVAQSNREWFVAKPIGRLGRPGLIPVTFVEVRDPASNQPITDIDALIDRGDLPRVEDWKRAMFNYKQNSINLGVLDDSPNRTSVSNSPFTPPQSTPGPPVQTSQSQPPRQPSPHQSRAPSPSFLPDGILLSADVVSFHFEMDEYWFRIDATYQPYDPTGGHSYPQAKQLVLFRVYNDFYDFQVSLLDTFPREAGREKPYPRILPFMPGPTPHVDHEVTATRRNELAEYLHKLCDLNNSGLRYVLEHQVVREFLTPKPGDVENDIEPRVDEMKALLMSEQGILDDYNQQLNHLAEGDNYESEVRDTLGHMKISQDNERSDGSDYEDEGYAPSPQRPQDRMNHPYAPYEEPTLRQQAHTHNHQRSGSTASFNRGPSPHPPSSHSRSNSPAQERNTSPLMRSSTAHSQVEVENRTSGYSSTSSRWPDHPASSPSSMRSSPSAAITGRSRSTSLATSNLNNPPISAANPQTAFVKIKIFDQVTDDLIAIRVHPKVTHVELMSKVQSRLGGEIHRLRYRDSLSNGFTGLETDAELVEWLESTDKHVLYAE